MISQRKHCVFPLADSIQIASSRALQSRPRHCNASTTTGLHLPFRTWRWRRQSYTRRRRWRENGWHLANTPVLRESAYGTGCSHLQWPRPAPGQEEAMVSSETLYHVSDPAPSGRGLCLGSTATLRTGEGAQLWLHRPTQEARTDKTPVLVQSCRTSNVLSATLRAPIRSAWRT